MHEYWQQDGLGQLLDVWRTGQPLDVWHTGAAPGCLAHWGSYWMSGTLGQLLDVWHTGAATGCLAYWGSFWTSDMRTAASVQY